jgi:hypothetical protein
LLGLSLWFIPPASRSPGGRRRNKKEGYWVEKSLLRNLFTCMTARMVFGESCFFSNQALFVG